jgi:uracil-DNA glycosylase
MRFSKLPGAQEANAKLLVDVYHVSLQNTNTGRLTPEMFDEVVTVAKREAGLA